MSQPVYIQTAAYAALVEILSTPPTGLDLCDPASRIKTALGEIANIWPASLLDDPEAEPGIAV